MLASILALLPLLAILLGSHLIVTILIVVLVIAVIGGLPSMRLHRYGWGPSGGLGVILLILIVLLLLGVL